MISNVFLLRLSYQRETTNIQTPGYCVKCKGWHLVPKFWIIAEDLGVDNMAKEDSVE